VVHDVHLPIVQSMGHFSAALQTLAAFNVEQATPPCLAATMTERERACLPPLHVREQVDQFFQADMVQSIGQAFLLHLRF